MKLGVLSAAAAALAVICGTSSAEANILKVSFSGTITSIEDSTYQLPFPVNVGDPISGSYIFNLSHGFRTDTPTFQSVSGLYSDFDGGPLVIGLYKIDGHARRTQSNVAGVSQTDMSSNDGLGVFSGGEAGNSDGFHVSFDTSGLPSLFGTDPFTITPTLVGGSASNLGSYEDYFSTQVFHFEVTSFTESLSTVPLPASAPLFGVALLGLAAAGVVRRRSCPA